MLITFKGKHFLNISKRLFGHVLKCYFLHYHVFLFLANQSSILKDNFYNYKLLFLFIENLFF